MAHDEYREELQYDEPAHAFDRRDPNFKYVWAVAALSFVLFLVGVGVVWLYFDIYKEQKVYETVLAPPSQELKTLRDREDRELHTYGIADRQEGTVRIPVDRAMQLLVEDAKANRLRYPTEAYPAARAQAQPAAPAPAGGGPGQSPSGSITGTGATGGTNVAPVQGGLTSTGAVQQPHGGAPRR